MYSEILSCVIYISLYYGLEVVLVYKQLAQRSCS